MYDSKTDTLEHIKRVNTLLIEFTQEILSRAIRHDDSKLHEPEKALLDKLTPLLRELKYGSEEYKASLAELKPALEHHYTFNSHHPEHWANGINDMTLFDIVEMFFDWKAATERMNSGDIYKSLEINSARFSMDPQLTQIMRNTAVSLKWEK